MTKELLVFFGISTIVFFLIRKREPRIIGRNQAMKLMLRKFAVDKK